MIDCASEQANEFPQRLSIRQVHMLRADVDQSSGSTDSAPGPHDYFNASLASCKALTAIWYARRNNIPLERVETHVEADAKDERAAAPIYRIKVSVAFHGAQLTEEQKKRLYAAVARCPIHKLMTTTEVIVETAPM